MWDSPPGPQGSDFILDKDPKNIGALLLIAGTASTAEERDIAIRRLEGVRADFGDRVRPYLVLAMLYLGKADPVSAERTFKEAVGKDPKSAEARVALGDFYRSQGDFAQAEGEYKAAAALAPVGSSEQIKLADFYLGLQKRDEAKRILKVTQKAADFLPGWLRLAVIALVERDYPGSVKVLDVIFKKNAADAEGHLLRGRVYLAQGQTTEAIQEFQQVLKVEPRLAQAHHQLALAYLGAGNLQQAKAELKEAISIAPDMVDATLQLSQLALGSPGNQAIEELEKLIARQPRLIRAHELLGTAYLVNKNPRKRKRIDRRSPSRPRTRKHTISSAPACGRRVRLRRLSRSSRPLLRYLLGTANRWGSSFRWPLLKSGLTPL
jgi:Tfp pilus assembly protein PilF